MNREEYLENAPYTMLRLVMECLRLDREIRCYGTDIQIYHSEIHMISAIAKNPELNVKGLADYFSITSASASEILTKLVKKGLVEKKIDQNNLKQIRLSLTLKGQLAHEEHMRYHSQLNSMILEELSQGTDDQVDFIMNFFENMQDHLKKFEF